MLATAHQGEGLLAVLLAVLATAHQGEGSAVLATVHQEAGLRLADNGLAV